MTRTPEREDDSPRSRASAPWMFPRYRRAARESTEGLRARVSEYATSAAVQGRRLANRASWRTVKVYVRPSDEIVGKETASSGMTWRSGENFTRPEYKRASRNRVEAAEAMAGSGTPG